jgi:hypothetical protein
MRLGAWNGKSAGAASGTSGRVRGLVSGVRRRSFVLGVPVVLVAGLFVAVTPASATVATQQSATFPAPIRVGQTDVGGILTVKNISNGVNATHSVTLNAALLVPSCAADLGGPDCSPANRDPGVFHLDPTGTGAAGTACAGVVFSISIDTPASGSYSFTPMTSVVLGPAASAAATCRVDFTFDVLKLPTIDADPVTAGIQTIQLVQSTVTDTTTDQVVSSLFGNEITVNPPLPVITLISPSSGTTLGGTVVTINGSGFIGATQVNFGTVVAATFTVVNAGKITATSPSENSGTVDISVHTPGGTNASVGADRYTFTAGSGPYSPLAPVRICDTRPGDPSALTANAAQCNGTANSGSTIAGGTIKVIHVGGFFGVPSNASAVVLNVTVVPHSNAGYLTIYPTGASQPFSSSLNWTGGVVPNLVEVGVGSGGDVSIFAQAQTDVVVDLEGYVSPTAIGGPGAGLYTPLASPARLCDTRAGNPSSLNGGDAQCNGPANAGERLTAGGTQQVQVTGNNGIPAGATAAVLNVSVVNPAGPGFLTVFPRGATQPFTANVNYTGSQVTGNRVIVPLSTTGVTAGSVSIFRVAAADVIVDVSGYYSAAGGEGNPSGLSGGEAQCKGLTLHAGGIDTINAVNLAGVPNNATAVVVNLTAITPTLGTFLTVFPSGLARPLVSDLNPATGEVRGNLTVATTSGASQIALFNGFGNVDVAVDVLGWYS